MDFLGCLYQANADEDEDEYASDSDPEDLSSLLNDFQAHAIVPEPPAPLPLPGSDEAPAPLPLPNSDEAPASIPLPNSDEAPASLPLPNSDEAPASIPLPNSDEAPASLPLPDSVEATASLALPDSDEAPASHEHPCPRSEIPEESTNPLEEPSSTNATNMPVPEGSMEDSARALEMEASQTQDVANKKAFHPPDPATESGRDLRLCRHVQCVQEGLFPFPFLV